jgi:hypothetical protein
MELAWEKDDECLQKLRKYDGKIHLDVLGTNGRVILE